METNSQGVKTEQLSPLAQSARDLEAAAVAVEQAKLRMEELRQKLLRVASAPIGIDEYTDAVMAAFDKEVEDFEASSFRAFRAGRHARNHAFIDNLSSVNGDGLPRFEETSAVGKADPLEAFKGANPWVVAVVMKGDEARQEILKYVRAKAVEVGCVQAPEFPLSERQDLSGELRGQLQAAMSEHQRLVAALDRVAAQNHSLTQAVRSSPFMPVQPAIDPGTTVVHAPTTYDNTRAA